MDSQMKVLLVMEQCNPEWASVPLVAYNFFDAISRLTDSVLVTHERNRSNLERYREGRRVEYIEESAAVRRYYHLVAGLTNRGGVNWPVQHALSYPVYAEFDRKVYARFAHRVREGEFDLVHVLTPMLPRYPSSLIRACGGGATGRSAIGGRHQAARQHIPFILGPVNGGVPFPPGFREVARKEFAHFNVLRAFSRLIPGYLETYRRADSVLCGSTFTREMLHHTVGISEERTRLFFENGIPEAFFHEKELATDPSGVVRLLFVGRLVAYKGADMLIEALGRLPENVRRQVNLTIVGDGPEREGLVRMVGELGLQGAVHWTGWVRQDETARHYQQADIFCFPSIREFGGAVVLEAMAHSLPCIVVDNGGIAEYVTAECGFRVAPTSRQDIVDACSRHIAFLVRHPEERRRLAANAHVRAREFAWPQKGRQVLELYKEYCS